MTRTLRSLRHHGTKQTYLHDRVGWNSRLDEIQAAVLRVKLRHLERFIEARIKVAAGYRARLAGAAVTLPAEHGRGRHVYHQFTIRSPKRDAINEALAKEGIASSVFYPGAAAPAAGVRGGQPGRVAAELGSGGEDGAVAAHQPDARRSLARPHLQGGARGMKLPFTKMHGAGNDFVVLDCTQQAFCSQPKPRRQSIADRHLGVGCDQILVVEKPRQAGVDFRYRIFNADGGEVEQCGNGARCFVKFVRDEGLTDKREIRVETAGRHDRAAPGGRRRGERRHGAAAFDRAMPSALRRSSVTSREASPSS